MPSALRNGDTSSLLSRVRTRFVHSIFHRTPRPTQRQAKRAKSITSRHSDLSSFLQEEMSLAEFPFGLGYSRRSAPAARSPPIDEAAQGDYRSIA
jgi:hypothetical protein